MRGQECPDGQDTDGKPPGFGPQTDSIADLLGLRANHYGGFHLVMFWSSESL